MDKKIIKKYLNERFLSEDKTPGISVTAKNKKESGKINKAGVKDIEKKVGDFDDAVKADPNAKEMAPNKYVYTDDFEETYHSEMEIMNGQEMIQYTNKPDDLFTEKALEAIEGSSRMGNNSEWANVVPKQQGFTGPEFGKNLVKRIKASAKKRSEQTPTLNLRGRDIQADLKDTGHKPYAIEENTIKNLGRGYTHFAVFKANNKIADGWDYTGEDTDSIKQYVKMDIINNFPDNKVSDFKIVGKSYLMRNGIDPSDANNWYSYNQQSSINENDNNKNTKIKEKMIRLKFKEKFNGLGNALKLIPEGYRVDKKTFDMTDGNESYRIRWEGTLSEGKAVVLTAADSKLVNEDIDRMKALYGYKSQDTLGLVKGNARINENKVFGDIWNKSKVLLGESEDIDSTSATEGDLDKAVSSATDAKKHIEGSVSNDKGTQAPAAKVADADKAVSSAKEAKKHVEGSTSTDKGTQAPKPKNGNWDDISVPQAADAKKHIHLKESEDADEDDMIDEMEEMDVDTMMEALGLDDEDDEEGDEPETDDSNWAKSDDDSSSFDDKEPSKKDIKNTTLDLDSDDDDEDAIVVPTKPTMASGGTLQLSKNPTTGVYAIIVDGDTKNPVIVPSEFVDIASDRSIPSVKRAEMILAKLDSPEDDELGM